MISITSQNKFIRSLVDYITENISGSEKDLFEISENPRKKFFLGSLSPRKGKSEKFSQEESKSSIRTQRISVSFLVNDSELHNVKMVVKPRGYVFIPIANSLSENKKDYNNDGVKKWRRFGFSDIIDYRYDGNNVFFKKINFSPLTIGINDNYNKSIESDTWKASIDIEITPYAEQLSMFKISLTNNSIEGDMVESVDRSLFDCSFVVDIDGFNLIEFEDEYYYNDLKQKYYYYFRPINCQIEWVEKHHSFTTKHYSMIEQPNVRPSSSIHNLDLSFENLKQNENVIDALSNLISIMKNNYKFFIEECSDREGYRERIGNKQNTWEEMKKLTNDYDQLISDLEKALFVLNSDQKVLKCLVDTHTVFFNYYKINRSDIECSKFGWRLFQFVFLLTNVPAIVNKDSFDIAKILHVDTGGGKSEAYFALVVFSSFFERLIGKESGVTAIVKFPLRMLSIQQLERLASIIIHAEEIRKRDEFYYRGDPFSLGYYVGDSEDFPNSYIKLREKIFEEQVKNNQSIILSGCPLCKHKNVFLNDDRDAHRITHECGECGVNFFIYMTDTEIFKRRPTVIVSTVDKWAAISLQKKAKNILGGSGSHCPDNHGFIGSGEICETNPKCSCQKRGNKRKSNTGPILSIQDEMHLLREGFGTISSHFEGALEQMVNMTSGNGFCNIAMSATLNGIENQVEELYNKNTKVIPGRCPNEVGSELDIFFDRLEGPNRIIIGLKPNFRDNHYATLMTLLHFSDFIINSQKELMERPDLFLKKYDLNDLQEGIELIKQYLIPLTYHLKVQDAEDMARLEREVVRDEILMAHNVKFEGRTLTGSSTLKELKEIMKGVSESIEHYNPNGFYDGSTKINPLYSTSVISHGVDLEELNFMVFQGLPFTTSEYIQALSRVGRNAERIGVVIVWFYPNRIRDDSFFRNFVRYHETLDHQVKPIPIKRDVRLGKYQTFNSLFCTGIINYLSEIKQKPLKTKSDIRDLRENDKKLLYEFIKNSYGSDRNLNIRHEIEKRIDYINSTDHENNEDFVKILSNSSDPFFRSQTGMRGIQKKLVLSLSSKDQYRV